MLAWESGYRIGHENMDSEHLVLFSLLNQLDININEDLADDCLADVLRALQAYIDFHFAHEEALMASYGYAGLENHQAQHRAFVARLETFQHEAEAGDVLKAALKVRGFVIEWLIGHILETDAHYARFIDSKEQKRQAAPEMDGGLACA
jgi:hemerythrin-like metal-binding protein